MWSNGLKKLQTSIKNLRLELLPRGDYFYAVTPASIFFFCFPIYIYLPIEKAYPDETTPPALQHTVMWASSAAHWQLCAERAFVLRQFLFRPALAARDWAVRAGPPWGYFSHLWSLSLIFFFFDWKLLEKYWKMTPFLCACAVVMTLETQKCQKRALRSFEFNFFIKVARDSCDVTHSLTQASLHTSHVHGSKSCKKYSLHFVQSTSRHT